jgi:hypothetical protein
MGLKKNYKFQYRHLAEDQWHVLFVPHYPVFWALLTSYGRSKLCCKSNTPECEGGGEGLVSCGVTCYVYAVEEGAQTLATRSIPLRQPTKELL